jgi:hypothetical protein
VSSAVLILILLGLIALLFVVGIAEDAYEEQEDQRSKSKNED